MLTNKSDFLQWRNQGITELFLDDMIQVLDEAKAWLMENAGKDQLEDRRIVGLIAGVQWLVDWQPTLIDDEGDEEDAQSTRTQALS